MLKKNCVDVSPVLSHIFCLVLVVLMLAINESAAFASSGTGMPWESALTKIQESINGPVSIAISLVAISAAGVSLYFGGDLQGFMRTACYLAVAIGLVVMSSNLLQKLYSTSAHINLLN